MKEIIFALLSEEYHEEPNPGHSTSRDSRECAGCVRIARVLSTALLKNPITAQEGATLRIEVQGLWSRMS